MLSEAKVALAVRYRRPTVYEDGYVLRGQGVSIRIGNKMEPSPCARREEGMSKARQRLAIEAPVLLLGCGKFALLFISILDP
jgi:hypothetical protein